MARSAETSQPPGDAAAADSWWVFRNQPEQWRALEPSQRRPEKGWLEAPPWRSFQAQHGHGGMDAAYWEHLDQITQHGRGLAHERLRGETFRLPRAANGQLSASGERILLAVNAAIHLRRPLLVTGQPGSGKTSLAYAIAAELGLGPVLVWSITPRSRLLEDGLYRYDALARLQQADLDRSAQPIGTATDQPRQPPAIDRYLRLGPVGTAFLPSPRPRVLLIDEIDKGDLQLPSELLHLFEEGRYEISELTRAEAPPDDGYQLRTADARLVASGDGDVEREEPLSAGLSSGFVRCHEFPIVVMTSNREREFSPAFHRRCIRVGMPSPDEAALTAIVAAHFTTKGQQGEGPKGQAQDAALSMETIQEEIRLFLGLDRIDPDSPSAASLAISDVAVDQLLNTLFLLTRTSGDGGPSQDQLAELRAILQRNLSAPSDLSEEFAPGADAGSG